MKRAKRIYILLGVLAVVCVAAFAVIHYQEKQEEIQTSGETILSVDPDAVQFLSWEYQSEEFAFHRDENWVYDADEQFPVDTDKIQELLEVFQDFGAAFIIQEVTDFGQYGLDNPQCTIQLTTEDTTYEIKLGDYSAMDSQRYVSIGDGNVYLAATDPLDTFDVALSDLIQNDEIPQFDQADSIQFAGEESYQVTYQEGSSATYCDEDVYFKQDGDRLLPLDTSLVESYLSSLSGLELTDYVTYTAGEEDLSTWGLDDPELTVTVTGPDQDGESQTVKLSISRDPAERAKAAEETEEEADEEEEITAYARVGESQIVYRISSDSYRALMAYTYDDLRHTQVLTADFADITGLDISLEGAEYSITSTGTGDKRTFYYQEEELDTQDLEQALENLTASSFTRESPSQKEEISLTVHLDNENYPSVQIQFYRYDGEQCLAVVDGQPVSLVSRTAVVDLIEAINAIIL